MSGLGEALAAPAAVVGIVGFGFQCLAGCIQGFQLFSTAFQVGKQTAHYRCAILLEEERLLLWANRSGLADNNLDRRLNEAVINQVLSSLQELLTSTDKLSKRYKLDIVVGDPPSNPAPHYDSLSGENLSFLESDALAKERARLLEEARRIQKHMPFKRFWFAAIDKTKFKELLRSIGQLIQSLYDLLDAHVQDDILQQLQMQKSDMLQLASQLSSLRALLEAYNLSEVGNIPEKTLTLLRAIELVPTPASADEGLVGELQDLMDEASQSKHASLVPLFRERMADTKQMGPGCLHGSVVYDGKTHYVEWKRYDWSGSEESRRRIQDSIVNLAMLLNAPKHPLFRTLDCVGIIDEPRSQRYMYMYQWPVKGERPDGPRSLHELISSSFKPSLTDRVGLSRQLVHALFYLHLSNWMHKSFSSHNVLFFPKSSEAPRTLNDPYIVGFSYSRQDAAGEPSEKLDRDPDSDIYRHPDCLEEDYAGFHKSYDVYSLGLVLFEIAKWRPIKETFLRSARAKALKAQKKTEKELTKQELRELDEALLKECRVQDIKDMRKDLLDPGLKDNHPVDLAFRAGEKFKQVVLTCLGDEFDKIRASKNDRGLQATFFRSVWKPFEKFEV
jgi:Prion-inhibition and propagation